jgi:hypothetical protein
MSAMHKRCVLGGSIFLLLFSVTLPLRGQDTAAASGSPDTIAATPGPPDATLFTTYSLTTQDTFVSWIVCGSTVSSTGCYSNGSLGPFGRAGALLEGNPSVNLKTNTVTRAIYVVDIGSNVVLYVYKKTDVVSSTYDTATVTLSKTVILPLIGGSTALCSMAANNGFLFIGTDQSPQAVRVQKNNFTVTQLPGFSPPINVTAITADKYGYVTVTQGGFAGGNNAFTVYGPNGNLQEDGGGADFMLNTVTAVSTTTLPKSSVNPAQRLGVTPKAVPE